MTVIQFPGRTPAYPRCETCGHEWHGTVCLTRDWRKRGECGCPTSVNTPPTGDAA
jgi:hypothetical protein